MATTLTHGDVVTWESRGEYSLTTIRKALETAKFDSRKLIRDMLPRHAFARACHNLAESRIIRKLEEGESTIKFQFTKEVLKSRGFEYDPEAFLTLDKVTGKLTGQATEESEKLCEEARKHMDREVGLRKASDVTRLIKRIFARSEAHSELMPLRSQGGAYFVPARYYDFLDRLETFAGQVGTEIGRFPIASGTVHGDRSLSAVVSSYLKDMINEYEKKIEELEDDSSEATLARRAKSVVEVKTKIDCYASYLTTTRENLMEQLAEASKKLAAKTAKIRARAAVTT